MRDIALHLSGGVAVLAALVHGILGETRIFAKATIEPARIRLMLRLVWQCGAMAWIGLGVLLAMAPTLASEAARAWIVWVAVATFGLGAIGSTVRGHVRCTSGGHRKVTSCIGPWADMGYSPRTRLQFFGFGVG